MTTKFSRTMTDKQLKQALESATASEVYEAIASGDLLAARVEKLTGEPVSSPVIELSLSEKIAALDGVLGIGPLHDLTESLKNVGAVLPEDLMNQHVRTIGRAFGSELATPHFVEEDAGASDEILREMRKQTELLEDILDELKRQRR